MLLPPVREPSFSTGVAAVADVGRAPGVDAGAVEGSADCWAGVFPFSVPGLPAAPAGSAILATSLLALPATSWSCLQQPDTPLQNDTIPADLSTALIFPPQELYCRPCTRIGKYMGSQNWTGDSQQCMANCGRARQEASPATRQPYLISNAIKSLGTAELTGCWRGCP